jgi:hypothetical protein
LLRELVARYGEAAAGKRLHIGWLDSKSRGSSHATAFASIERGRRASMYL